ncbi:uncharacterized protein LOC133183997 [Saccostrea echinata]|uniref:uncharacterized protein LOC133183997 n=1 Tax=Saccostrea echinata TaxID=191078 RepID=UPI002A81C5B4|nr:uncharacterized protein LOC133183997 [Saccostrea echinata]
MSLTEMFMVLISLYNIIDRDVYGPPTTLQCHRQRCLWSFTHHTMSLMEMFVVPQPPKMSLTEMFMILHPPFNVTERDIYGPPTTLQYCGENIPCNRNPYKAGGSPFLVDKETIGVPIVHSFSCNPKDGFYRIKVTCMTEDYQVDGPTESACKNNHWVPELPHKCVPIKVAAKKDQKWVYIGGGLGGGALAIILLVVTISIVCYRAKLRSEKEGEEILKMKKFGSHTLGPNAERFYNNINLVYPTFDISSLHKVWTIKRTRKKFFYADTLGKLLAKAGTEFGCQGNVRLVLEEDGTQVETDEILRACAGRVMLILGGNEVWQPEIKLYDNEAYRLTFDVCSFDRKDRKLVLADSIKDLKYQGSTSFGYSVTSVCLEEDGTMIDDDRTLCSCSMKTLMLLGVEHAWMGSPSGLVTLPLYKDMSITDPNTESYSDESQVGVYKVWTEDRKIKKVVFAENIIDLHLKASKALGLRTPVVVTLENNETFEIADDDILKENTGKILIVREKIAETSFNQVNDHLYDDPVGQNKYNPQQSWPGHQLNSVNYNYDAFSSQLYGARNSVHENSGFQQIPRSIWGLGANNQEQCGIGANNQEHCGIGVNSQEQCGTGANNQEHCGIGANSQEQSNNQEQSRIGVNNQKQCGTGAKNQELWNRSQQPRTVWYMSQQPRTVWYRNQQPRTLWSQQPRTVTYRSQQPKTVWYRSQQPRTVWYRSQQPKTVWYRSQQPRTVTYRSQEPRTVWYRSQQPTRRTSNQEQCGIGVNNQEQCGLGVNNQEQCGLGANSQEQGGIGANSQEQ